MKKKIVSIAFVAAIAVAAAWNFTQNNAEIDLSDLALANVEMLAYGEGGGPLYPGYAEVKHYREGFDIYAHCTGNGYLYCI
ncbi:MAG: NVEALA domain-containing protein [Prevotella sp.]|nr:NVEALA domain-containing protein [Prevotella sp.]